MENYWVLASLPFLSAFIGWLTNMVAIKMIFRPQKCVNILGVKIQGLLPKRQEEIAVQLSETIEEEFFSSSDVVNALESLDFDQDIEEFIDKIMDERLQEVLEGIPLLGSFVTSGVLSKMKVIFKKEIKEYKKQMIKDISQQISHSIDVKQMIYEKISDYDIGHLEGIVKKIAKKELRYIEWLGAGLGFVIGLVQILIVLLGGIVKA